ncbi:MAG: signal peptidase I, partial [Treponemataceae bacterium]|nr:signal peptidase I [Treponemataceae bacterium]
MTENDTENTEKASPGFDKKEAWEWIKSIGLAVIIAWFILTFVIVNAYVPSGSMETTIMTNDRIIALRPYYMFNDPKRGDIAVFKFPDDESLNYV